MIPAVTLSPHDALRRFLLDGTTEGAIKGWETRRGGGAVTDSPQFKTWFKDSKVVDEQGDPLTVYHGTTHDVEQFKEAGTEGLNPESDWGAGVYFTSDPEDASENYAGKGPDLTSRIEQRVDELQGGDWGADGEEMSREAALAQATKELAGKAPSIIPAYVAMQNPLVVGKENGSSHVKETHFTMEYEYADPNDSDSDIVGEKGTLPTLIDALRKEARQYDYGHEAVDKFVEKLSGDDYVSASKVAKLWRESDVNVMSHPETGKAMTSEVLRAALERMGFDGVVDRTVNEKFGSSRKHGQGMKAVHPDTTHFIAFQPTQIKSALGNQAFDPKNPKITMTYRERLGLLLDGTTEGAIKGWETRRIGGKASKRYIGTTRQGPPAASLKEAHARGYTDGPYYHSSDYVDEIERDGFLSRGAAKWELDDPGSMEDYRKWGTARPTMFAKNKEDVVEHDGRGAYGNDVITVYAKPGAVKSAGGMTLMGGLYVSDPRDVIPIKGTRERARKVLQPREPVEKVQTYSTPYRDRLGFLLYGTTEGVIKGWETRRHGKEAPERGFVPPRRVASDSPIAAAFRNGMPEAEGYSDTRFILPDGTRLTHHSNSHWDAAESVGENLYDAMQAGIVRVSKGGAGGFEVGSRITEAQAQHIVDSTHYSNESPYVDVYRGRTRSARQFDAQRTTADDVRQWVNDHFPTDAPPKKLTDDDKVALWLTDYFDAAVHLGDVEGHPFRGNQWTEGSGVPAEPGTTPIPAGKIRGYHYTDNLDAVEQAGLDVSKAKGSNYGEPNAIWFSTRKPSDHKDYVEVFLDPEELAIGSPTMSVKRPEGWRRATTSAERQEVLDDLNKGTHDFTVRATKIAPDRFVTVHRPWHDHYRYFEKNAGTTGKGVLAGEYDDLLDDPDHGPAIRAYKAKHDRKLHADRGTATNLGDFEGHPFRGNQWTAGAGNTPGHGVVWDKDNDHPADWARGRGSQRGVKSDGELLNVYNLTPISDKLRTRVLGDLDPANLASQIVEDIPGRLSVAWKPIKVYGDLPALHMQVTRGDGLNVEYYFVRQRSGDLVIEHHKVEVPHESQGQDLAKYLMESSYRVYDGMGVKRVDLYANLDQGGYAWARFGFKDNNPQRTADRLHTILTTPQQATIEKQMPKLTAAEREDLVAKVAKYKNDPRLPWYIAGSTLENGTKVGQAMLNLAGWSASMDMNDKEARARLATYISQKKKKPKAA